jgi:hypothetical protein
VAPQQQQQYDCSSSPLLPAPSSRRQQQQQRPLLQPPSAAAGGAALPAQPADQPPSRVETPLQPIKLAPAAIAVAFGLLVKFVLPSPAGITPEAWTLFSVFLSTILGLVLQPLPVGAWAFLGLCVVVATKTLPFAKVSEGARGDAEGGQGAEEGGQGWKDGCSWQETVADSYVAVPKGLFDLLLKCCLTPHSCDTLSPHGTSHSYQPQPPFPPPPLPSPPRPLFNRPCQQCRVR